MGSNNLAVKFRAILVPKAPRLGIVMRVGYKL